MLTSTKSPLLRALFWLHTNLYRLTGGRVLGIIRDAPVLLLTTTGRKSGKSRTRPLLYLVEGDTYVVIASNSGSSTHPAWYRNLRSNPAATVQLGRRAIAVTAEATGKAERARLWAKALEMFPNYATYQRRTAREIPVVVLKAGGSVGAGSARKTITPDV